MPPAPSGVGTQSFCGSISLTGLSVTGSTITWYDAASGGNILSSSTNALHGVSYYATQTINGCESTNRIAVQVSINTIPASPTGTATQTFCNTGTVADLTAVGSNIQWYAASTGGTALSSGTLLTNGSTYYASQTSVSCESVNRFAVTVTINTPTAPTGSATQDFCNSATVANLTASGTSIQWYATSTGGTTLSSGTALTSGTTYYASQSINGCESINRLAVTVSSTILNATVTQTGITLTSAQSGVNYAWLDCTNGNQPIAGLNGQSFIPTTNGSYALQISLNGCSAISSCVQINSVGLDELKLNILTVKPNPTNGNLTVLVSKPTSAIIMSSNGLEISNVKLNGEIILDTSNYASGIYFIRTDDGQVTKFIKN